jgi:hypothetical protein
MEMRVEVGSEAYIDRLKDKLYTLDNDGVK